MAFDLVYSLPTLDVLVEIVDNPNGSGETTVSNPPIDTVYDYLPSIRVAVYDRETGDTTIIAEDATSYRVDDDGYIVLFKAPVDQLRAVHDTSSGDDEADFYDIRGSIVVYDAYEKTFTQVTGNADFALGDVGGQLSYRGVQGASGDFDTLKYWVDNDPDPLHRTNGVTTATNRDFQVFTYTALERDIVLFSRNADRVDFRAITGVEHVAIAEGADLYHAGDGADTVILAGTAGEAAQSGFTPGSWFYGDRGNDTVTGGALADRIDGGAHDDHLTGLGGGDTLVGGLGIDILDGGALNDTLDGGGNDDELIGGTGNDALDGGSGADRMTGGTGRDSYVVDSTGDQVIETSVSPAAAQIDTVSSSLRTYTLTTNVENLVIADGGLNGRGNTRNNDIAGNDAENRIEGGGGLDHLDGGDGDDMLFGDERNDTLLGGGDDDLLVGGLGKDIMDGGTGADLYAFDATNETPTGARRDVVTFSSADGDRIDLSGIDANLKVGGNQGFAWVDDSGLAASFTRAAGQLRFDGGILMGDVNGDGRADFHIEITGTLALGDVIL